MKRPQEIQYQAQSMQTIVGLTSAFESMSSMKLVQTKNQVLLSNQFFDEVWNIYKQVRINTEFNYGRAKNQKPIDKELLVLITAAGSLTGDIDNRLISQFRKRYEPAKNDVIVIGRHGASQLDQLQIKYIKYFDLPLKDIINVSPLIAEIKKYQRSRVFYQDYISLSQQDIKDVDLSEVVSNKGLSANIDSPDEDTISERNYIFEPSAYAVAEHLELSILRLTLSQFIYDSRLAQLASRFQAMSAARERSTDSVNQLNTSYRRAKRAMIDTRIKESLAGLKRIRQGSA
jgi:F-type H+-transporting ATPase subunit gamma